MKIKYILISVFLLLIMSCKSTEQVVYGYPYGNPLCMSPEELVKAKEKIKNGEYSWCNHIAIHYESLEPSNMAMAMYWWTYGAEHEDPLCMYSLGFKLIDLLKEEEEGIYWLKKAAEYGEEFAIDYLERRGL
jgi:TPR repeat protein